MLKKVETYILEHKLLTPNSKVIVGVSGGADSVALLLMLKSLDFECIVAHCNFHLRKSESDSDAVFVQQLALKLQLPFCKIDFDTTGYAQANKISIEMAARELRYTWFEEIRQQNKADAIAVAHHADDNVETFLMNLTRGAGMRGLTAIPKINGFVVRPLLSCNRNEILGFLHSKAQSYVTDSSNAENKYTRNRFRNQLIPLFEQINPSFSRTISGTIKRFEEIEKIYSEKIAAEKLNVLRVESESIIINIEKLKSVSFSNSLLYELLSDYNFHAHTIDKINNCIDKPSGALFYSPTHRLLHDRDSLIITSLIEIDNDVEYQIEEDETEIFTPLNLSIARKRNTDDLKKSKFTASFDASKLRFPLILRHWKHGDVFVPFGMKSHKKLSDFFIDNKIDRFEKEKIWLLISENKIIWIVGYRSDNRYKVNTNTKTVIEICMNIDSEI